MQIKGTSVKETLKYIRKKFPKREEEWINSLSEESKKIYNSIILTSHWFDLYYSQIEPQKKIGELFFDNNYEKAAYDLGKHGAYASLNGIYKLFIKVASIDFVIKKASTIFSTYFSSEAKISVIVQSENLIKLSVKGFSDKEQLQIHNITGWLDGLLSIISKEKKYEIKNQINPVENNLVEAFIFIKH